MHENLNTNTCTDTYTRKLGDNSLTLSIEPCPVALKRKNKLVGVAILLNHYKPQIYPLTVTWLVWFLTVDGEKVHHATQ